MFKILVVEDNINLQKLYCAILRANGFESLKAENGKVAMDVLANNHVDLVILDIMMPEMDGYELTKKIREFEIDIPIFMITAKDTQEDKKKGFLAGADDYMTKPIDEEEMLLRIKALLRRYKIVAEKKVEIGSTTLYYDSLMIDEAGKQTYLPKKEFYLLYKLLSYPGKIFTKNQLLDEIWGFENESDNTLNVHINRLRNKFDSNSDFSIITARGIGFKAIKKE